MTTHNPDHSPAEGTDVLGQPITTDEIELRAIYERLEALANREDLAPCTQANVNQARALLWNACNDLGLL